ncbi:unnamed protein product [Microthlaspi erraticum]|uniref:Telomeric single stranded DNA binding POT1/Cdc13 domain-containing protein n=1 Tax=Microthlaspi erraticum TaxID=1685480 RepID=A0A6D2KZ46_9BRAS|nr:unnamed protein product [Microthlaspi erraticum]
MEKKKKSESLKLVKIRDAINLINQEVNLLGVVIERREPKQCRNKAWICTLRIIDDSYHEPGLTVNVFSNKIEELPDIKNKYHNDMILFTRIKMQSFGGDGKGVSGACRQRASSFAVYEGRRRQELQDGFVCYQYTSNFLEEAQYKSSIAYLGKVFASSSSYDEGDNILM